MKHLQSVLKVNIDPTAPSMDLTLKRFGAASNMWHAAAKIVSTVMKPVWSATSTRTGNDTPCKFSVAGQELPVPVANAPAALQRCMQPPGLAGQRGYGVSGGCGAAGLQFVSSNANNSYSLSQDLLQV